MSDWFRPVPIFEGEDEEALKAAFAALWAKHPTRTPAEIGQHLFADLVEPMRGLQAGAVWSRELPVIELRDRLRTTGGDMSDLPSKDEIAREVLARSRQSKDDKEAFAGYKLYSELCGYIEKPGVTINQDNRVVNVLRVPTRDLSAADDADFDARFKVQQTALIADARSSRPN